MAGINFAPPQVGNLQGFNVAPPPNPDPLATLAQMGQLRTQALQQQEAQLGLQQKSMDIQSERGFLKAYIEANGDPEQAIKLAPGYGVLPKDIFNAQKMIMDWQTAKANLSKVDLENTLTHNDMLHNLMQPMFDEKDPNKQAALAAQLNQEALNRGLVTPETQFQYNGPESARLYEAGLNTEKYTTTQAQAQQARQAAEKDRAEAAKTQLETQIKQSQLNYLNTLTQGPQTQAPQTPQAQGQTLQGQTPQMPPGPQGLHSLVDAQIDPQRYPDYNKRAYAAAQQAIFMKDPQAMMEAISTYAKMASEQEKQIGTESDPRVIQARIQQAYGTELATAPIKKLTAIATTVGSQQALAALGPQAFSPIADAATRNQALNKAADFTADYIKGMTASRDLLNVIDAAQKGNQTANAMIPIEQLRAVLNRITTPELEQTTGFGTLYRKLDNELSKNISGKWSGAQLKEFRDLANLRMTGAQNAYDSNRQGMQAVYGVTPPAVDISGIVGTPNGGGRSGERTPSAQSGAGKIVVIDGKGNPWSFDSEAQARAFEDIIKKKGGTTRRQ